MTRYLTPALALVALSAVSAGAQTSVSIRDALPDVNQTSLFIDGQNFCAAPTVTLAGSPVVVQSATPTQVIVALPPSLAPGTYYLVLSCGTLAGRTAYYDVALGAIGPAGPAGPAGPTGPAGADASTITLGGDVTGAPGAATVVGLAGRPLAGVVPNAGQALTWNGSAWAPASSSASGVGGSGTVSFLPRFTAGSTLGDSAVSDSGSAINVGRANFTMNGRNALQDLADGWLRLNHAGSYGNGIYSPGSLRVDGGLVSGGVGSLGGGTINATGAVRANGFQDANGNQVIDAGGGWHRTYGNTGWYNATYGGGWYMTDSTWLRSYNSKKTYMENGYDSGSSAGAGCGGGLGGAWTFQVCGTLGADSFVDRQNTTRYVNPGTDSQLETVSATIFRARDLGEGNLFIGTRDENGNGLLPGYTPYRYPTLGTNAGAFYVAVGGVYAGYFNTGGFVGLSDERMKTDIHDLGSADFRDALAGLEKIRSVRYHYKQEAAHPLFGEAAPLHFGVIAQSLPDPIRHYNKDLGLYDVSISDLVGYLVASVRGVHAESQESTQGLQARIATLEQQLAEKDEALRSQDARLTELEAALKALAEKKRPE